MDKAMEKVNPGRRPEGTSSCLVNWPVLLIDSSDDVMEGRRQ
jgi:hypothetical protein